MMKPWESVSLVDYTEKEERLHTLTHAAGLILSGCIAAFCLVPSVQSRDSLRTVCASLYLFGTTAMFLTSALYHAAKQPDRKRILRLLDHCMIFFAVAGTATGCVPTVFETVGSVPAVLMAVFAWTGAVSGLLLTFFSFKKTKGIQMCLYIGTSFACAVAGGKAYKVLPPDAFYHLLTGGAFLLLGAALYGFGRNRRYFHAVFHVFIVIGLTVFFLGIRKHCFPFPAV